MTVFEAHITNLGKYAEVGDVGETLKFPATTEEVQSLLKNIGVDGVRYEEFFITAFDGDVMGLYDYLTEYENLDELNHLAHLISELDSDEIETLEAALNKGDHTSSVADIINLVHNLDCYDLHPGVTDDETLGRIYVEDMELLDEAEFAGWTFPGGEAKVNEAENRLQLIFEDKPDADTRQALKSEGFKWAPSQGAWQRQLNQNAIRAAARLDFLRPEDGKSPYQLQPFAKRVDKDVSR